MHPVKSWPRREPPKLWRVVPLGTSTALLNRHLMGDWGDMDDEDKATNDRAVKMMGRLLSAYTLSDGTKLWVITDAGHEATTFLLPEEY